MPTNAINDTGVKYLYDKLHGEIEQISDIVDDSTSHKSGNPISITGLKSTQNAINPIVTLEPIQDLHGQDKPYPAGMGKNKFKGIFDQALAYWGNVTYTYDASTDSYTITGIGVAHSNPYAFAESPINISLSAVSITNLGTASAWRIQIYNENTSSWVGIQSSQLTSANIYGNKIRLDYSTAGSGCKFTKVQLEEGSSVTPYAPYENECPILGYDEIDVMSCGKNLLDSDDLIVGFYDADNWHIFAGDKYRSFRMFFKSGTYVFSSSEPLNVVRKVTDGTMETSSASTPYTLILTKDAEIGLSFQRPNSAAWGTTPNLQVEYNNQATTYETYHKSTDFTETLPETVYWVSIDLNSGILTVIGKKINMGEQSYEYRDTIGNVKVFRTGLSDMDTTMGTHSFICECYGSVIERGTDATVSRYNQYADDATIYVNDSRYSADATGATALKTALSGVKLVYKLATPIKIQLTPQEIELLKGYNYISTNGTRIDLAYRDGEMATLGDVLDAQNKLQEEIDNPISYDGKNYRLGMDATGLYLYNITDDTKAYIQMVTT